VEPGFGLPTTGVVGLLHANKALKVAATIILLAGLIGGGLYTYSRTTSSQTLTANKTTLHTAKATLGDITLYADGTGTIMPAEESSFGFNASGQVSEIYVQVGERVKAGQVLAQLDDTEENIALAEAQAAMNKLTSTAAVATAKQTLGVAQTSTATEKRRLNT